MVMKFKDLLCVRHVIHSLETFQCFTSVIHSREREDDVMILEMI